MDTDKYDACSEHTQDECMNRTSDIHCTYYGQIIIHNTSLHRNGDATVSGKNLLQNAYI